MLVTTSNPTIAASGSHSGGGDFFSLRFPLDGNFQARLKRKINFFDVFPANLTDIDKMDSDLKIFLEAPDPKSPDELAHYLDEACGGDKDLRSRVEALFEADVVEQGIVDRAPKISDSSAPLEAEGNIIHNYKLLQKIGEGGFGDVYMAEQFQPVKRRVALKIIKLGMDTKQVVARFEAERQALAMMDHPNIAKVHDAGATELGRPYFVMELVRGIPITKFCDEQNLDTKDRLALFIDVCHAVQHAHQKGVIHRDLKPTNVMVTMHDDRPVVKVIDFGVAKATQTDLTDKTLFTKFDQFIGTPAYMSPEQAQFSGLDIDTRSDIYTLGVLLYELLTGSTPFDSKQMLTAGYDEIRRIIKEDEPELPSSRLSTFGKAELTSLAKNRSTAPTRLPSQVKGDLDWIVMKAIEKDRTRRYDTANALAADIGRHLDDEPVIAAAPSPVYRLKKYINRHRALLSTAAVVITSLLIGTTVSIWKAVEANRATVQAKEATKSEETLRKEVQNEKLIVQHRIAEEKLASGDSATGIAHLARLLREEPSNLVAAERLVSAIRENPQPQILQVFQDSDVSMSVFENTPSISVFDHTGAHILIVSQTGEAQVFDAVSGERRGALMLAKGEAFVMSAQFNPDGKSIVICKRSTANTRSTAAIINWHTGEELHPPFELDSKPQTCEISPDGKLLLLGCPHKACVWDLETGEPWPKEKIFSEAGYMGTFSPDSSMVAFSNGKVRDARTGDPLPKLKISDSTYTISFSPDSKHAITAAPDGEARIFDPRSGKLLSTLHHLHPISSASYSPDGKTILTASPSGELNLWDAISHKVLRKFELKDEKIFDAKFSKNGRSIMCTTSFGSVFIWNPHLNSAPILVEPGHSKFEFSDLSPDGTLLLTTEGGRSGRITLRKVVPAQPMIQTFRHKEDPDWDSGSQFIFAADFSPTGDRIITGPTEDKAGVWDAWNGERLQSLLQYGGVKFRAGFSPGGDQALLASNKNGVTVWDLTQKEPKKRMFKELKGIPVHAAFSPTKNPDGNYYLVIAPQGSRSAQVYDATTGEKVGAPLTYGESTEVQLLIGCFSAAFSPDSTHITTASNEGHARVWRVSDSMKVLELEGQHQSSIATINYSPDGRWIVTASNDGAAVIWNAETGDAVHRLHHGSDPLNYAEFSPDSQSLVSTSNGGFAKIWDVQSGLEKGEILKHDGFIRTARFSSDNLRVVTCSFDNTARIWDASTGLPLSGAFHHEASILVANFSPDGTRVLTAGADTLAHIWDFPPAPRGAVPKWVPDWAEAVAGLRIDDKGTAIKIPHQERQKLLNDVPSLPDDNYYARTAKWLASDPDTRLITPFSKMSKETWVNNRILENTVDSLEEALGAAPNNPEVSLALARALVNSPTGDRETNLGQAAVLADQVPASPEQDTLIGEIDVARAAHYFDQQVSRLEKEAIAAADIGETATLAHLHRSLILANFLSQSDKNLKLTTELRRPNELIDIEFRDLESQVSVQKNSVWHYLDDNQPPPPNWTSPDFNHDSWQSGPAPLGYGEDETTKLAGEKTRATAFYFRQWFDHQKHPSISVPSLSIRCDDGAVIYLNGEELLRFRMPEGQIAHDTEALKMAGTKNEAEWHDFEIDPALLKEKDNILAVEIHQKHTTENPSSDLYLALEVSFRPTEASYLKQLNAETLTRGLSHLSLALPPDLAPIYLERWKSAILPPKLPNNREALDLRAKFLKKLKRYEEELATLEALIDLYPLSSDYAEFIVHIDCLRRISECLSDLGREEEALAFNARIKKIIPPRPENLSPLQLDLTDQFNINFFGIKRPPFWGSLDHWSERIPEIFDPGDGPDFDIRGLIQLNTGKYTEGPSWLVEKSLSHALMIPVLNKVRIEVDQTFGAIHFLQTCKYLREHVGTEIAHYLIHYQDGTQARIPVIVGEGLTDYLYQQRHGMMMKSIRHLAFNKTFRWNQWNNDSANFGLFRQSWTNPHPEKRVSHLEFVSAQKQAAPHLLAVTLEPQDQVSKRIKDLPQKLKPLEEQLENISDLTEAKSIRKRRNLLREIVPLLEDLGHHDRARRLADELVSIPPRPEGLSAKQIDLTEVYTESFFLPGINLLRGNRYYNWGRIPEQLQTVDHLTFDVRGAILLNSGIFPRGSHRDGKDLNRFWTNPCPDQVTIPISQKFQRIHFLQTCHYRNIDPGTKAADYVIHYDDGTTETIPVIFNENTFDNTNASLNTVSLAPGTKAVSIPWKGEYGGEQKTMFALQTWENPHPYKVVTHLDFVSAKEATGPLLAGITVE